MQEAVIVAAYRTAIGKFGGTLAQTPAHALGAALVRALMAQSGLAADQVDEVIMGQVLTAGAGQNPARQTLLSAGLSEETSALTINKVCGSGLRAVQLAAQAIRAGDAEVVIAGGQENMSMAPHVLPNARSGKRLGDWKLIDTLVQDGLWCAFNDYHMGCTAENLVEKYAISREEQDRFAAQSQHKAQAAQQAGRFREEIVPISVKHSDGSDLEFVLDEYPRFEMSMDALSGLPPVFNADGTVTAGNASGINDGAAAVLVMSAERAQALNLTPMARITGYASAGVDPAIMGTGPIKATRRCLDRAGWQVADLDLIESNEAFAAQAISVNRELGWELERVNVNGGAIALGHPIGASGARILVTLLHEMRRRAAQRGLATLCIGGGQGVAMAIENLNT